MTTLAIVALYCLSCYGAGIATLRLCGAHGAPGQRALAIASTAFLLGQGVVAAAWIPLGLAGWFNPFAVGAVVLACAVPALLTGRAALLQSWRDIQPALRWLAGADRPFQGVCALLLALWMLLLLDAATRGPLGDAEAFYLAYPKVIAAAERLIAMPGLYSPFSQIGLVGEMHFAALIALDGAAAAKLLVWPTAMAAGIELAAIAAWAGAGWRGRWIAVAILFTSTGFTNHVWDGKVDVFAAAFGLAAVRWILAEREAGAPALRCGGLLAGFSTLAKISYIPVLLPALGLLLAWREWNTPAAAPALPTRVVRKGAALAIWVALPWLPNALKNGALFGTPLAPFIGGDGSWLNQVWFTPADTLWIVMTYPLALTFGRYPMQSGNVSFVLLAFLPLAFYLLRTPVDWRSSRLTLIALAGLAGLLIWVAFRPSVIAPRYFFVAIALLIPLAARAAEVVYEREEPPRWLRASMLATLASALVFVSFPLVLAVPRAMAALQAPDTACAHAGRYCAALMRLNGIAAPGDRVYLAGYYGYWLRPDLLQCQATPAEMRAFEAQASAAARARYLRERGFRHLIVDKTTHMRIATGLFPGKTPAHESAELAFYDIDPGPAAPRTRCIPVRAGAWKIEGAQ